MGGADVDVGGDQAEADGDAVVVAVDGQGGQRRRLKRRTAALVLGPTPGRDSSQARASATGISARKSSESSPPRRSVMARRICWSRGAFCSGQVQGAIGGLDLGGRGVADARPVGEPGAELLEGAAGVGVAGPVREERGDELAQRVEVVEERDRAPYSTQSRSWTRRALSRSSLAVHPSTGHSSHFPVIVALARSHPMIGRSSSMPRRARKPAARGVPRIR